MKLEVEEEQALGAAYLLGGTDGAFDLMKAILNQRARGGWTMSLTDSWAGAVIDYRAEGLEGRVTLGWHNPRHWEATRSATHAP